MNRYLTERIIPFEGIESFKLGMKIEEVRSILKANKIPFNQTEQSNKGTTSNVPWVFITVDSSLTFCFAKEVMYEMYFENQYSGRLPNGVCIGMDSEELMNIDSSLMYNDEEEDFESQEGYWVVDDVLAKKVVCITIFLPIVETESFYNYEWVNEYLKE